MFVPRAQVYLGGSSRKGFFSSSSGHKNSLPKHELKCFEFVRMPCLCPTLFGTFLGIMIIFGGIVLCIYGYNPKLLTGNSQRESAFTSKSASSNFTQEKSIKSSSDLTVLTYLGPVLMGIGFFVSIVALVLYCEIKERYVTQIVPEKDVRNYEKDELFDMIVEEFRKNYFRGIEVPLRKRLKAKPKRNMPTLFKALSISTPALLITPEMHRRWQRRDRFMSVSDAQSTRSDRMREPRRRESWLKTSSLPNIRPKSSVLKDAQKVRYHKYQNVEKDIELNQMSSGDPENRNKTSRTSNDTGVDNPAFRESPTNGIQLREIHVNATPPIPNYSPLRNTQIVADVIVHNSSKPTIVQRSNSDARGFTQRRHRRSQGSKSYWELYDAVEEAINSVKQSKKQRTTQTSQHVMKPTDNYQFQGNISALASIAKSLQDLQGQQGRQKCQSEIPHKSILQQNMLDGHCPECAKGPYCTRIGIYKSESDLYELRHHYVDMDGSEQSSYSSLENCSDVMKSFDHTHSSQV